MRRVVIALMVVGVTMGIAPIGAGQAGQSLDYEAFCKLPDVQAKREAFLATSPENRAVLVRTQLERWRDANRARLNDKQLAALAELIAAITPDTYAEGPKAEEARLKARPLAEAQRQLFTIDEIQAMQPTGPCIAKAGAQTPPATNVCGLLPKAEVKKLIGGGEVFDSVEPTEKPVGSGSSCRYAGVFVMVGGGTLDGARKGAAPVEAIPNVGDAAYLYGNPAGAVELFVKVGPRLLSISRSVEKGDTNESVRPGVIALAKALVAKLQ